MTASPESQMTSDVMHRYVHDLYNARDLSLIPELLADPMYRHDAGGAVITMSNEDCRNRTKGFFDATTELRFRTIHLLIDGPYVSWTYELTSVLHDGTEQVISSIEVFEVRYGNFVNAWNAYHTPAPWQYPNNSKTMR
jgi:hypothetical protein